jgi:hydroxypyruvate reductase
MNPDPAARRQLDYIGQNVLDGLDPYRLVQERMSVQQGALYMRRPEGSWRRWPLASFRRTLVLGVGKGAYRMAQAIEALDGLPPLAGLITTKYGFGGELEQLELREAGHPLPDEAGREAAEATLRWAETADEQTLVLLLISGGGSALWAAPQQATLAGETVALSLADYQALTDRLLKSGAGIEAINTVRKHLSRLSGGRLARALAPAQGMALVLSDVLGDPLAAVSSGPAVADPTTYREAIQVLQHHQLWANAPEAVRRLLEAGQAGELAETLKPHEAAANAIEHVVIGNNRMACKLAATNLEYAGAEVATEPLPLRNEVRRAAERLLERAIALRRDSQYPGPVALVAGGEVSVAVSGSGTGGRQQQFALAFLVALGELRAEMAQGVYLLAAATDGNDGPTDAAGAFADATLLADARDQALDPAAYLANNDAYTFFQALDGLFMTGPSGTNVNDLFLVWVE